MVHVCMSLSAEAGVSFEEQLTCNKNAVSVIGETYKILWMISLYMICLRGRGGGGGEEK
jgi:hypothetical protein